MARLQGGASRSEAPPSGGPSRKAPAATGLRSRRWKSPGRCGPVGTDWHSYSLLRPRRAPGGVEGPGVCAPVAWSAAPPAFCLLLPSKASFLSNSPFWGVGICFNPTRPRAQTAPLGFLARGDQGPWKGQRRAQPRRLFSSSPRRISQAREVGPAYRGAVTKKGLSFAGALGGARCSGVTRGSARASSKVEPADCRDARPRVPPAPPNPPAPSLPQNGGDRRLQGASKCAPSDLLTTSNLGLWCSGKARWKADLLLQFTAGFSEDASPDGKLGGESDIGRNFGKTMSPFGARLC
ncbi:uncharacterized protein LOC111521324 isoform X1 [Piliocolobus tephrosceles]|uniref:uncharacterized protein LOC111521324 isoform X1 n=1 Tax=Piliocolobus tephrosceles TaxID=591936 RepID=UPI000C2B52EB|nr:uncharacterized protein LOC111521324 isoform X1 [Piliocolobus tephrosceles]